MVPIWEQFFFVTAPQPGVNFEIWDNIPGMRLQALRSDPRFPNNPSKTENLNSFDTPLNRADNYGARVTTYYQVTNTYSARFSKG